MIFKLEKTFRKTSLAVVALILAVGAPSWAGPDTVLGKKIVAKDILVTGDFQAGAAEGLRFFRNDAGQIQFLMWNEDGLEELRDGVEEALVSAGSIKTRLDAFTSSLTFLNYVNFAQVVEQQPVLDWGPYKFELNSEPSANSGFSTAIAELVEIDSKINFEFFVDLEKRVVRRIISLGFPGEPGLTRIYCQVEIHPTIRGRLEVSGSSLFENLEILTNMTGYGLVSSFESQSKGDCQSLLEDL